MSSENRGFGEGLGDSLGDEGVGEEHKLLDEAVGVLQFVAVHRERIVRLAIHFESNFRRSQRQRARADSPSFEALREVEEEVDAASDLGAVIAGIEVILRLLVAIRSTRAANAT